MNGYLLSVIGTVLISSVLTAILPEGKTRGLIQSIARLACVLAIVSPVLSYLRSGNTSVFAEKNSESFFSESVIRAEESFIKYYSEMRIGETENALQKEILEKYGRSVEVSLDYEMQKDKIKIVKIGLKIEEGTKEEDVKSIKDYLMKNYCKEVLVE